MKQTKRLYLDLDENIIQAAKERALAMRISQKRYVELLIERDVKTKLTKGK